jgi:hypothetical protein
VGVVAEALRVVGIPGEHAAVAAWITIGNESTERTRVLASMQAAYSGNWFSVARSGQ